VGIVLLLFVATCLYLRLFYDYTNLNGDEGVILQGAQRILNGEVLYRDFFSFSTPGSYYWMALLFKVFGNSILVARAALVVYGGVFSVLTYLLARRVCSRWTAVFTVYLLTLTCLPYVFMALHNWDSTLWACLALYFAVRFLEAPHWGLALAVGTLASLTCLFEQSKGAGLLLGLAMGFGALILNERNKSKRRFARPHLWAFLAGFMLPALLTVAYFASQHSLPQMLADCLWPLQHYTAVNKVPYGFMGVNYSEILAGPWGYRLAVVVLLSPCFLLPALPILAVGALGFWLLRLWRGGEENGGAAYYVLVSATLVGLSLSTMASRPEFIHMLFQAPLFFLILAWGLDESCFRSKFAQGFQRLLKYYILLSFTGLGLVLLWRPLNAHSVLETRRGALRAERSDPVLRELQARVRPGHKIFVYPYQPLYYYLSATSNATQFEFLFPGMHTPGQLDQVVRELAADRTPLILFQPSFSDVVVLNWPSTPIRVLAEKDALTEYMLAHYRACTAFTSLQSWQIVFMVRKDLCCTGPL
jgi:4-amino-4-deoxy-L-arabinose transferase-like glycosyltransferase